MIIKEFRKRGTGFVGQNAGSWADNWKDVTNFEKDARNAARDHLSPFFKKYFPPPPGKILEGGCGTGKYVIAYGKMGYKIIGVDFAGDTITRLRRELGRDFPVYDGDITSLEFEDDSFDCYYSGGVIEHFEKGPDEALREARRVLKKGGIFLATVPYVNLIRRTRFLLWPSSRKGGLLERKVDSCAAASDSPPGYEFCEYLFDLKSIRPYFEKHNLLIEAAYPTDFLWGELGWIFRKLSNARNVDKKDGKICAPDSAHKPQNSKKASLKPRFKNFIYDFLITEDVNNMFYKAPLFLLNHVGGHMILFVARAG